VMGDDERKLFVGKLPQDIHEDEIRMIFNTYGRTTDVHLMSQNQQQPGQDRCAFVTYETPEAAKVAMQVLNGVYKFREDADEPINVGIAFRRDGKGKGKGGGSRDSHFADRGHDRASSKGGGYDRGPPPAAYDRGYDRGGSFDRGCDRGGGKGGGYDRGGYDRGGYDRGGYDRGGYDRGGHDRGGKGGGYDRGFERGCYDRDRGHGSGGGYDRGLPPRGYDRMPDRGPPPRDMGRGDSGKGVRKGGAPNTKLYVGNLPADITREAVDMVFSTYGRVQDVHIMNARAKNGQSCAFVIYSNSAEAKTAISAMQVGYEIRPGEGNIFVKYADDAKGGEKGRGGDRGRPY